MSESANSPIERQGVAPRELESAPSGSSATVNLLAFPLSPQAPRAFSAEVPLTLSERALKRGFDLVVATFLLVILIPVATVIALLVKLESRGPVFFLQERIGRGDRPFTIIKFRSMKFNVQDREGTQAGTRNDPRVTRIGRIIRSTSLDEIPQLLNVLKGDMSMVGPRPHASKSSVDGRCFSDIADTYSQRHMVKPGITGLAQVRGLRGHISEMHQLEERLKSDLEYIAEWTPVADLRILARTLRVMVHPNAF